MDEAQATGDVSPQTVRLLDQKIRQRDQEMITTLQAMRP